MRTAQSAFWALACGLLAVGPIPVHAGTGRPSQHWPESCFDRGPEHTPKEAVQGAIFDNCFLAGTNVETASRGGVAVEDVRVGDRIAPPPGHSCEDPRCGEVVRLFRNQTDRVVTGHDLTTQRSCTVSVMDEARVTQREPVRGRCPTSSARMDEAYFVRELCTPPTSHRAAGARRAAPAYQVAAQ